MAYALINYSCFAGSFAKSPGEEGRDGARSIVLQHMKIIYEVASGSVQDGRWDCCTISTLHLSDK